MQYLLNNKLLIEFLIIALRCIVPLIIYVKCHFESKKTRNFVTILAFAMPLIALIICIRIDVKNSKKLRIIWILCVLITVLVLAISTAYSYSNSEKYYDKDGNESINAFDIVYTDSEGIKYSYDYDKTGYDYLYSENKKLNANWCYLDKNGILYYDNDMSIICKDETSCIDTDGKVYYPIKFSKITKNGKIEYNQTKDNFCYDRFGNAYIYEYVPYYDSNGNKYYYSFDSSTQKGTYTDIKTNKAFDNKYSFVDKNGYFVYDKNHEFKQTTDSSNKKVYRDSKGKLYYWASSVTWSEDGNLLY